MNLGLAEALDDSELERIEGIHGGGVAWAPGKQQLGQGHGVGIPIAEAPAKPREVLPAGTLRDPEPSRERQTQVLGTAVQTGR